MQRMKHAAKDNFAHAAAGQVKLSTDQKPTLQLSMIRGQSVMLSTCNAYNTYRL